MKFTVQLLGLLSLMAFPLHARTWTSSDGKKTINGTFVSSVGETVKIAIRGKNVTFRFDQLSDADNKWVADELARVAAEKEARSSEVKDDDIEETVISRKLGSKVQRFGKKSYKNADLTKNADYYLIYFSASW